jgi:hypothetical protein
MAIKLNTYNQESMEDVNSSRNALNGRLLQGINEARFDRWVTAPVVEAAPASTTAAAPAPTPRRTLLEARMAAPGIQRTERGTIAFVKSEQGYYIKPTYNQCGMLTRVDLNGITMRRRSDHQWIVVDNENLQIIPADLNAVYFDHDGNLVACTNKGTRVTFHASLAHAQAS